MNGKLMSSLLFLMMLPYMATADQLSLNQAIELARYHSPRVLESAAQADAAKQGLREARAARLPSFEFQEAYVYTDSPADVFALKLMQKRFSFPDFVMSDPNRPSPVGNFMTGVQATMPLYTGGRLSAGIAQAAHMTDAATALQTRTAEAVTFMVTSTYMDALLADRVVELAIKARDTTSRHVEQAQAYFDAGMIVESDLLQARVQLAHMEENLITASNNATLAHVGLNRVMGVELANDYQLGSTLTDLREPDMTLDAAEKDALARRTDLVAVSAKVHASGLAVARAQGEFLPEIALVGSYSLNDNHFLGSHGTSYKLMALVRWNFWNFGQTQARVARSRDEERAAKEGQRSYLQQVEFEVRDAWQRVKEAHARKDVASAAVASAEKALSILDARFEQGITRITDLLDVETMLNEARTRDMQARFDLQRSIHALYFALGLPPAGPNEE